LLFTKGETRFIAFWLYEFPRDTWHIFGTLGAGALWAIRAIGSALAAVAPYAAFAAVYIGVYLLFVGGTAFRAKQIGRCLQIVVFQGSYWPGTYGDGCR
jgi:hypothetical protein